MIPTYINDVPRGDEKGVFLALDLGGTNLRVCEVHLHGDKKFDIKSTKYLLTDELKTGTATELFDYIADSVKSFLISLGHDLDKMKGDQSQKLYLGFTFSFPVLQTAIDKGKLLGWTKGFKAKGAVGTDVVKLLQDALDKKGLNVQCNALVNDTVGTLMARAYQSGSALVGAIFGTGTNGAYVERLDAVKKLQPSQAKNNSSSSSSKASSKVSNPQSKDNEGSKKRSDGRVRHMIINTEWGAFDNLRTILPVTKYDNKLDRESINPRKQAFEKMVSGMYIGELTRNVIVDFIDRGLLFKGLSAEKLNAHYGFDTSIMSEIEANGFQHHEDRTKELMENHFGIHRIIASRKLSISEIAEQRESGGSQERLIKNLGDWLVVERICELVGTRAARLSSTAIGAVILQTGSHLDGDDQKISIGVDGSVIERYEKFADRLMDGLRDLFDEDQGGSDDEGGEEDLITNHQNGGLTKKDGCKKGNSVLDRIEIELAKDGSGVGAALCALQAKKQLEEINS
ncbi:hypothetical protein BY996DRAFT_8386321 [Phakopsora pachyrhizi]|nr:hypothetical protein BY996DRAFT_8386321 [Phakopsora pachyrhizi]